MASIGEALLMAFDLHQSGRWDEADTLYGRILDADPEQADAWHLSGVLAAQRGALARAEARLVRAVALRPAAPDLLVNLGNARRAAGRFDAAGAVYGHAAALAAQPGEVLAWLAVWRARQGRWTEAEALARAVLADAARTSADALHRLGVALSTADRLDPARALLEAAARAAPDSAVILGNLGITLRRMGDIDQAEQALRAALARDGGMAAARRELAALLVERARDGEDEGPLREARRLDPDSPAPRLELALRQHARGEVEAALAELRRAVALAPDEASALSALAQALNIAEQPFPALALLGWAQRAAPGDPDPPRHAARILQTLRRPEAAADAHAEAERRAPNPRVGADRLLTLNLTDAPPAAMRRAAAAWAARYAPAPLYDHSGPRDPDRPLRVGYLVEGFLTHDSTCLPLVERHGPGVVPIVYNLCDRPDHPTLPRYRAAATLVRDVAGIDNDALAALIHADAVDVLVDGAGFASPGLRFLALARRPAPVQIHYPAMGTTGLAAVDGVVVDDRTLPPGRDGDLCERAVRLPCAYHCTPLWPLPERAEDPPCTAQGFVTFGSFNTANKIGADTLAVWAALLHRVPDSRLLLKASDLRPTVADGLRAILCGDFGLAPDRVEIRPPTRGYQEHMACYNAVDIHLDSFPYTGVTTSVEAMLMGVPVVSLAGRRILDRYGACLLTAVGLPELIAESVEAYIAIAAALANDRARLTALRQTLPDRLRRSPVMDADAFTASMEDAYRALWRQGARS
ncbi:tetratricopeptide repeat protein [Azospirillum griseum]|uniref:protein O-GlcNAc transferase n=1 Tax=Azospirillum griseum TaxID=2496639 RepID=A0A3S0IFE8_9PROT|nr:tetratricopeptide repeat protein [Azospirillum griseum]RTR20606.1 tetratricopeptide repeat protein [Azospirillum griseum]